MKSIVRCCPAFLLSLLLGVSCQSGSFPGGVKSGRVCEIHHCELERKTVPISYGLPMPDRSAPLQKEKAALFPHRTREVNGGCMPMPEKTTKLATCPQCDAAYAAWMKRNR